MRIMKTMHIALAILLICLFAGCASSPKIVKVTAMPFAPMSTLMKGKINLTVGKTILISDYTPESTNLDAFWRPGSAATPKFLTETPLYPAYKTSMENAIVGSGYELSSEGLKVDIKLLSANCGLFGGGTSFGRDFAVGLAINTAATFGGLGPVFTGSGGNPCTTIASLITIEGGTPQMIGARGCKFAFETEGTYSATMADAMQQTQNAVVKFLISKH